MLVFLAAFVQVRGSGWVSYRVYAGIILGLSRKYFFPADTTSTFVLRPKDRECPCKTCTMKRLIVLLFVLGAMSSAAFAQLREPVKWSYGAKRISASEAVVYLKANMEPGWHIYSAYQKEGGPAKTSFSFVLGKGVSLVGKIAEPKPLVQYQKVFAMNVNYFEKQVVFSQKVRIAKGAAVKGTVEYMACTERECLPPASVEFSIPVK